MATPNSNEIKSILTGLLTSSTRMCTIRQLCDDFFNFEGYRIPYQELGYNNVEEYFRSIPDTIIVIGTGPHATVQGAFKPKSAHIVEMVAKQKKPLNRQRRPIRFCPRTRPQSSRYTWHKPQPNFAYQKRPDSSTLHRDSTETITPVGVVNWLKFNSKVNTQIEKNSQVIDCGNTIPPPVKSQPNSSNIQLSQPVRSPSPRAVNLESLPSTSKPLRASVREFFETFPKEEKCAVAASLVVSPEPELEEFHPDVPKESENNLKISPEHELEDFHPHVPKEIRDNLRKLISEFSDGIWCSQLPVEYNKMFKRKLHFDRYSYRSLIEMCVDLPKIFNYCKPTKEDFLLCDCNKPFPKIDQSLMESTLPEKEIVVTTSILNEIRTLNWDSVGEKIAPPDILRLGETIPYFPFGDRFQANDYIDVAVGEIYDVSKFWINLEHGPLTEIMNDLQNFFGNNNNKYLIPEPLLHEGLYCCTLYLGKYHRGLIVNRLPKLEGFVRVFFIDYGTVENVCSNEIWFFPKCFAEYPHQAIRARLSDICPPMEGLPWSRKAIARFNNLITNTILIAKITEVDNEDNVLDIYLADVSDEKHIFYINNVLVDEGLAVYIDKKREVAHVDPSWIVDVKCLHLYPDFREIEAGSAPSLSDINYIIANNFPMHHYLPQYFDISFNDDIESIEDWFEKHLEDPEDMPEINLDEIDKNFDYSCFPIDTRDEIAEIVRLEESRASEVQQAQAKVEKVPKSEVCKQENEVIKDKKSSKPEVDKQQSSKDENSFKEYSFNKLRRAKLLNGDTMNEGESGTSTSASSHQGEIAPVCAGLNNLNLNNSTLTRPKNTNPFLNSDDSDVCTNPFLDKSSNPFLSSSCSSNEEINTKELLEIFSKPSEGKVQKNIVNNLNPSPPLPRKLKQVNVERCENLRSSSEGNAVARPIRAPPGFNVPLPTPNLIPPMIPPMIPPVFNYAASNPYYQRHPQQLHWNNTLFLQNQFGMAMVQQNSASVGPNLMNMPQFHPQFNLPYFQQQFGQNFRHPGPK